METIKELQKLLRDITISKRKLLTLRVNPNYFILVENKIVTDERGFIKTTEIRTLYDNINDVIEAINGTNI